MSKRFKTQDYFRYKKLGLRWRRPKGRQSKLRKGKSGSGIKVKIGYRTEKKFRGTIKGTKYLLIKNLKELENAKNKKIIISSHLGLRKVNIIAKKAKELGIDILNARRIKKIAKKRAEKKKTQEIKETKKLKAEKKE